MFFFHIETRLVADKDVNGFTMTYVYTWFQYWSLGCIINDSNIYMYMYVHIAANLFLQVPLHGLTLWGELNQLHQFKTKCF